MPASRARSLPAVLHAIGVFAILGALASSARAEDADVTQGGAGAPRGNLGVGLGGSWLPVMGDTSTLVARVSVGFDAGRYSLRALPTFQYVSLAKWPTTTMTAGYLAAESAFRVSPGYAVSIAPLAGYAHSPNPCSQCNDVVYGSLGNGLMLGVDVSPATFVFGPDRAFEVGVHGSIFEFPGDGSVILSGYLELRWTFAQRAHRT